MISEYYQQFLKKTLQIPLLLASAIVLMNSLPKICINKRMEIVLCRKYIFVCYKIRKMNQFNLEFFILIGDI